MAVRYDKKFNAEINRAISRYNAKINRLSKKGYTSLPEKFTRESKTRLKAMARTRTDIRRELKNLSTFTARGGEKTVSVGNNEIPKYQYENIKRYQKLASYKINQKLKKYETTKPVSNGKVERFTFAQQGSDEYVTLLAKKEKLLDNIDLSSMTKDEIENYLSKLKANTRDYNLEQWQQNYINIIQDTALSYGYDTEKLDSIVWALQNLDPEDFDELAFENRNIKEVLTHYQALLDISSFEDLEKNSNTVTDNLDSIYENMDSILAKIKK